MLDTKSCAECGTPLPAYWPKGLCAQCALDGALDMNHAASQVLQPEAPATPASPQQPQSSADSSPLGSFGEYDLLDEIARGGMGVVYKARQRNLGRIVAVKMILAGPLAGKEFVQRFRTESAAAAILQHPNIVAIHDVGVREGRHYFSMDYVEGRSLAQLVGQQPLAPARAARYVELIAAAIHYAHERGILHRDLKPSNVLIDANDQPRITDFGLARRLDGDSSLTLTGQVLGSPNFMPPEQAGGGRGKVGRPSDVYALGGILYHLLTARAPFQADSLEHLITQVLHAEPVTPRLLNPSIPRDLETITLKCLEKEPSRRYQTAQELADELGRFLRREPIHARPITAPEKLLRWGRRKPVLALLIVLLHVVGAAGLTGIVWQWRRAEHHLYVANMNVVQHRWEQNHVSRVRELLEKTAAVRERGFEWYYWQRQMHQELKVLRGHTKPLLAVAYSPDGQRIVTGSADHTAKVWDAASGKDLLTLRGHGDSVESVAFSPDGQRILTGSWDSTAMVWDATYGTNLLTLKGHEAAIFSVAFSSNGQRIVTGSQDRTAKVWDAVTGTNLVTFSGHTNPVWAVAFSPDGQRIVSGGWDQTARVWDAANTNELRKLVGHRGAVLSVAFSPDGRSVVTGGQDHQVIVWTNDTVPHILRGHGASVFSVGFSPDGKWIISGSADQTARVWDAASGEELRAFKGHGSQIGSVALSPDGQRIVTGGGAVRYSPDGRFVDPNIEKDPTAKVWDAGGVTEVLTLEGHKGAVTSVDFSADGRLVVSGSFDGTARVWDVRTGQGISSVRGHGAPIRAVAFLPDGKRFVTGSFDGTASVWDVASGEELHKLKGHTAEIFSVAASLDGRRIATGSWDGRVKLWDAATGTLRLTFPDRGARVFTVAFSPDGQRMVSASGEEAFFTPMPYPAEKTAQTLVNVDVWDANSGKALFKFQPTAKIWSAAFSRDGRRIVTGTHNLTATVWDAANGKEQLTLKGHTEHILAALFSPDGRRIVTGSADQTAKLWDAATGEELLTLKGHSDWVFSVAFSPDGQRIVTGSRDHTIKVWEAASKEQVAKWQEEGRAAAAVKQAQVRRERLHEN